MKTVDQSLPLENNRHEKFCQEYTIDFNGARAYRTAGYEINTGDDGTTASAAASRLLRDVKVSARLMYLLSCQKEAFECNQQTIKEMTVNVLRASPLDYMAISESEDGKQTARVLDPAIMKHPELITEIDVAGGRVRLMDKNRALEHMLRIEKLLVDSREQSGELMARQNIEADEAYRRRMESVARQKTRRKATMRLPVEKVC